MPLPMAEGWRTAVPKGRPHENLPPSPRGSCAVDGGPGRNCRRRVRASFEDSPQRLRQGSGTQKRPAPQAHARESASPSEGPHRQASGRVSEAPEAYAHRSPGAPRARSSAAEGAEAAQQQDRRAPEAGPDTAPEEEADQHAEPRSEEADAGRATGAPAHGQPAAPEALGVGEVARVPNRGKVHRS